MLDNALNSIPNSGASSGKLGDVKMINKIKTFIVDEDGAAFVEYALLTGVMVAVAVPAVIQAMESSVVKSYENSINTIEVLFPQS